MHGSAGTVHLCLGSTLLLLAGTVHSHIILALGGLLLCLQGFIAGKRLVALLGSHHSFIVETLHALVGLLGNLESCLSLLPQLVGTAHLFLTGSGLSHITQGRSGVFSALSLSLLGLHLGCIQNGEGVAHMHVVAFVHT